MSPAARAAAASSETSPIAWASSGIRAATRSRCSATETHTLPNRATTAATIRAVSGVSAHGQTSIAGCGSAKSSRRGDRHRAAGEQHQLPRSRRQRLAGRAAAALREHEQGSPNGATR